MVFRARLGLEEFALNEEDKGKEDEISLEDLNLGADTSVSPPSQEEPPAPAPPPASVSSPAAESVAAPEPAPQNIQAEAAANLEAFLQEKAPDLVAQDKGALTSPPEPERPSVALLFFKEVFAKLKRLATNPREVFRRRSLKYTEMFKEWGTILYKQAKGFLFYLLKDALRDLTLLVKGTAKQLKSATLALGRLPLNKNFYLVVLVLASFVLTKIAARFGRKNPLPRVGSVEVTNFEDVANRVYDFDPNTIVWEEFESAIRLPNHTVTLNKIVVNFKMSERTSLNPMGYLRLNLETSNKEAAVEVLDREREIADVIQRAVEEMTYDAISTVEGKNQMKVKIRKKINEHLNRGRIKRVLIQDIIIKR